VGKAFAAGGLAGAAKAPLTDSKAAAASKVAKPVLAAVGLLLPEGAAAWALRWDRWKILLISLKVCLARRRLIRRRWRR
jgi:hypothetical protein